MKVNMKRHSHPILLLECDISFWNGKKEKNGTWHDDEKLNTRIKSGGWGKLRQRWRMFLNFYEDYKEFPGMTSTDESYTIKPEACKNEVKKKLTS